MKIRFTTIALLAVLSIPICGCQKESIEETFELCDNQSTPITVSYSVSGTQYDTLLENEDEWYAFLGEMMALAREGYEVSFSRAGGMYSHGKKETITYTTHSEQDAIQWCELKTRQGYDVTVTFNDRTGEYTCIAIR